MIPLFIALSSFFGRLFHQFYTFVPFTERLPPGIRSLDEILEKNTMIAVANWFFDQYTVLFDQVCVCTICM